MIIYICYARHTFRVGMENAKSMDYNSEIIEEVLRLRKVGLSIPKVAHALARDYPRYCWHCRKQKNIASPDVMKIIEQLKSEGRLPASGLDKLKVEISNRYFRDSRSKPKNP